jgi:Fe2+ transport system protein FeoA
MKLKDAEIGKVYEVLDIQFCDDCHTEGQPCMLLGLMERGLVPGSSLEVVKKDLGLYHLRIDDASIIIRKPEAEKFNIEVE